MGRTEIVIQQNNASGEIAYWQKHDTQSVADRHGVSTAEYIHALYGLLRQAGARQVLMIGGAGGTLASMLARAKVAVDMVDIDPLSFEIARRYFHLPATVACHVADGAAFLRTGTRRYDAIVLDAYAEEAIPRHLVTTRFFGLVKARLKPGGVFLANLIVADDDDPSPDRFCYRLRETFRRVRLLDSDGFENRNAIAAAGAVAKLKPPRLLLRPKIAARTIADGLKALAFRPLRP